jgi:hypothetical protein
MNPDQKLTTEDREDDGYRPPTVTFLGTLTELTQKTVGAADGTTFLGLDIGEIS